MKKLIKNIVIEKKQEKPVSHSRVLIAWSAPSVQIHQRGPAWFIFYGIGLALIMVYSFVSGSWTTAMVFLMLACVYLMTMNHGVRIDNNAITELGIQVGSKFYAFSELKGFWLVYKPPYVTTLHLLPVGKRDDIIVQLALQDPVQVRNTLSLEIPEIEGGKESLVHKLIRIGKL